MSWKKDLYAALSYKRPVHEDLLESTNSDDLEFADAVPEIEEASWTYDPKKMRDEVLRGLKEGGWRVVASTPLKGGKVFSATVDLEGDPMQELKRFVDGKLRSKGEKVWSTEFTARSQKVEVRFEYMGSPKESTEDDLEEMSDQLAREQISKATEELKAAKSAGDDKKVAELKDKIVGLRKELGEAYEDRKDLKTTEKEALRYARRDNEAVYILKAPSGKYMLVGKVHVDHYRKKGYQLVKSVRPQDKYEASSKSMSESVKDAFAHARNLADRGMSPQEVAVAAAEKAGLSPEERKEFFAKLRIKEASDDDLDEKNVDKKGTTKSGLEWDATSKVSKNMISWDAGERKKAKQAMNRRKRRDDKAAMRRGEYDESTLSENKAFSDYKAAYEYARKQAQPGRDMGIEKKKEYGKSRFVVKGLPGENKSFGHELRMQRVKANEASSLPVTPRNDVNARMAKDSGRPMNLQGAGHGQVTSEEVDSEDFDEASGNWKELAKKLLDKDSNAPSEEGLGARAYYRAVIAGQPTGHLTKLPGAKGRGAQRAREKLIDLGGMEYKKESVDEAGLPKGEYWASIGKTPWGDKPHKLSKEKSKDVSKSSKALKRTAKGLKNRTSRGMKKDVDQKDSKGPSDISHGSGRMPKATGKDVRKKADKLRQVKKGGAAKDPVSYDDSEAAQKAKKARELHNQRKALLKKKKGGKK